MTKPLLALALLLAFPAFVSPQSAASQSGRGEEIMRKVGQLDALIQIVPLALSKDQISPILSAIERAHQKQRDVAALDAKDLEKVEAKVSKMVDEGINKGIYPPREAQKEIAAIIYAEGIRRNLLYDDMVDTVFKVCKTTLNQGQLKVMEKSIDPTRFEPPTKGVEMDADAKIKYYVRRVLLDPPSYDVLIQMSKRSENAAPSTSPPTTSR